MLAGVINSAWDLSDIYYIVLSMFTFVPHDSYFMIAKQLLSFKVLRLAMKEEGGSRVTGSSCPFYQKRKRFPRKPLEDSLLHLLARTRSRDYLPAFQC